MSKDMAGKSEAYKAAGVDIDLATSLLAKVKGKISSTRTPDALAPIGGFGGLFRINLSRWKKPVMVTSIDGVGTKLMVAAMADDYSTVGHDIVNHCVNDIAVQGAEPVYFMDYIGIGKLRSPLYETVLNGIADACAAQNMTLIGGETAEMPGMYGNDFDLVGCITGIVEEDGIIDGTKIKPGYAAVGIASVGLHTNGFSLARKVLFDKAGLTVASKPAELGGETLGQALLKPHRCYWQAIKTAIAKGVSLDGLAHITGGGLYDNVPRILPQGVGARFYADRIDVLPIFKLIQQAGDIEAHEMYRVFNMGVGMVWFVPQEQAQLAIDVCGSFGYKAAVIGEATAEHHVIDVVI